LIFGYKVVIVLVGVNADDFFEFNHAANTRGHAYKLFKSRSVNNIRQNFFAERIDRWRQSIPHISVEWIAAICQLCITVNIQANNTES